ncbi:unnamed protein product [Timema podura]|uniref:Dendritic cell-specific transmembrane protein-like domain-containing protein n=1 Tax=Timema podura TaxID=61482 RepID=A0ABN7PIZ7_TIMPD|nr:unnamed protein product [Timema podura]
MVLQKICLVKTARYYLNATELNCLIRSRYWPVRSVSTGHSLIWSESDITGCNTPNMIDVNIEGQGILADLFRIVVKAFKPFGIKLDVDTTECLPDPLEPDLTAYIQICECYIA